jgi:hypothetical protein
MGHKGPVLRSRCSGPGRAQTQYSSILFLFCCQCVQLGNKSHMPRQILPLMVFYEEEGSLIIQNSTPYVHFQGIRHVLNNLKGFLCDKQ